MKLTHFIGGADVPPSGGGWIRIDNPRTLEPLAEVASGTTEDVDAACRAASAALAEWRERRPIGRGRVLTAIAAAMRAETKTLAALEAADTGKLAWQAAAEVEGAAQYFEFYAGLVNVEHGETIELGSQYHSYTRREPFGVVGIILPWNAPLNQAARGIAPAIAVGNTVAAKPSEQTSASLIHLARIAVERCGLPAGVLNVVLGAAATGEALVRNQAVRKIAFTGSVRGGRAVAQAAADRIIPCTLELGGKSPDIIFEDADLEKAIPGALRAFTMNAGQICTAGTRILVQRSIYEKVLRAMAETIGSIKSGPGEDSFYGPQTTAAQFEKVKSYYAIADKDGAKALVGGSGDHEVGKGRFLKPTIYRDVTPDMRIAQEEIFGPVAAVMPFEDEAEAVRIANGTEFGLAAGVWTRDLSRALRMASALEAGQVYVNEYQAGGVETPLGGYKQSGYGREKGIEALKNYTQVKAVTIKL